MTDGPLPGAAATDLLAPAWFLLCWLGHTRWLFAFLSLWVVLVLYRREFRSQLLATLG